MHIIWDLDGTLIDSSNEIESILRYVLNVVGISKIKPQRPFRAGPPLEVILDMMYPSDVLGYNKKEEIISLFRKTYDNCGFNNTLLFAGIENILRNNKFFHHIVTNKPNLPTIKILKKLGISNCFISVNTPDTSYLTPWENEIKKTKTGLFSICKARFPNNQFIGIGDMNTDIKAAFDVGIPAIGVLWGTGTKAELEACNCTYLAASVSQLSEILNNL